MEFIYSDGGRSKYFKAEHVGDCVTRAICNATGMDYKEVYDALKDVPDARLILQIHDELIIQARREDEDRVRELLSDSMQNAAKLAVKLDISLNTGENWYELK